MPEVLDQISQKIQQKYHIDKPYMKQVTVDDLKNLNKALVEAAASTSPGAAACNTCCCCCTI